MEHVQNVWFQMKTWTWSICISNSPQLVIFFHFDSFRYMFSLQVMDNTGSIDVILYDKDAVSTYLIL